MADKSDPTASNRLRLLVRAAFEGHDLTLIEYRGAPAFIAREVGLALGYARKGGSLVHRVTGNWAAEFRDGEHYHLLTGAELECLRRVDTDSVSAKTRSLLLLTELGLYRVLMLTGKPVGIRLRDWLDSEVLPSIARSGSYGRGLPGPTPGASKLRDLLNAVPAELRAVPIEAVLGLLLAEEAAGRSLPALKAALTAPAAGGGTRTPASAPRASTPALPPPAGPPASTGSRDPSRPRGLVDFAVAKDGTLFEHLRGLPDGLRPVHAGMTRQELCRWFVNASWFFSDEAWRELSRWVEDAGVWPGTAGRRLTLAAASRPGPCGWRERCLCHLLCQLRGREGRPGASQRYRPARKWLKSYVLSSNPYLLSL